MTPLVPLPDEIVREIPYATADNFVGEVLYPAPICLVHEDLVAPLHAVRKRLCEKRLDLKVWDGYRPPAVQQKMWDLIGDPRYVAPPERARHCRGTAIDLTLIDGEGRELPMPTPFDELSERAHYTYTDLADEQMANRALLRGVMEEAGFVALPTEWWHFDLKGWEDYPLLEEDLVQGR